MLYISCLICLNLYSVFFVLQFNRVHAHSKQLNRSSIYINKTNKYMYQLLYFIKIYICLYKCTHPKTLHTTIY